MTKTHIKPWLQKIENSGVHEDTELHEIDCNIEPAPLEKATLQAPRVKDYITQKMHFHSRMKYPEPAYEYHRYASDGKQYVHITYHPEERTPERETEILAQTERHAIALRKLSILGGLATGIETEGFLGIAKNDEERSQLEECKQFLLQELYLLAENVYADPLTTHSPDDVISEFYNTIADRLRQSGWHSLQDESNIRKLIGYPTSAELWFLGEYNRQRTLIEETVKDDKKIVKIDVPLENTLPSLILRNEYERIMTDDTTEWPDWYTQMSPWEKNLVRKELEQNGTGKHFVPCKLTHIPGLRNARTHHLATASRDNEDFTVRSTSMKSGMLPPYDSKTKDKEITRLTAMNASILVEHLHTKIEEKRATDVDRFIGTPPPPLIFIQSLVTGKNKGSPVKESRMAGRERDAMPEIREKYPDTTLLLSNSPVNFFRKISTRHSDGVKDLLKYAEKYKDTLKDPDTRALVDEAILQLKNLENRWRITPDDFRNFQLMRACYVAILVEAMGGEILTHCKDGKDRTGWEEIYRDAMLEYWHSQPADKPRHLPSFLDPKDSQARNDFVELVHQHFSDNKAAETASSSAEGCHGLKDQASPFGIVCSDVWNKITEHPDQSAAAKLKRGWEIITNRKQDEPRVGARLADLNESALPILGILKKLKKIISPVSTVSSEFYLTPKGIRTVIPDENMYDLRDKIFKKMPQMIQAIIVNFVPTYMPEQRNEIKRFEVNSALDKYDTNITAKHTVSPRIPVIENTVSVTVTQQIDTKTKRREHLFSYGRLDQIPEKSLFLLAALQVKELLSAAKYPAGGIELFGPLDPGLTRAMQAYCQLNHIPCNNSNPLMFAEATEETRKKMAAFIQKTPEAKLAGLEKKVTEEETPASSPEPKGGLTALGP